MSAPARFPFIARSGAPSGPRFLAPLLPARLSRNGTDVDVLGLVDSGAMFSVLPYDVGARFGEDWNRLPRALTLAGTAGGVPAKVLALDMAFGPYGPVPQLFAWSSTNAQPAIFGQVSFFLDFDIFFFRARGYFEIQPASAATP